MFSLYTLNQWTNYFVWNQYKFVLDWKLNDLLDSLGVENGTCWVAGVDDDQSLWILSFLSGLLNASFQFFQIQLPPFFFIQVVRAHVSAVQADGSGVKWVLWDGNHNWIIGWGDQSFKNQVDTLRSTFSQENVIYWWGWHIIFSADVIGHSSSDWGNTQWVSVTAGTDDLIQVSLSPLWSIRIDTRVTDQTWIQHAWKHFSVESDWFLLELLRVADVTKCDLVKRILFTLIIMYLQILIGVRFAFGQPKLAPHLWRHTGLLARSGWYRSRRIRTFWYWIERKLLRS